MAEVPVIVAAWRVPPWSRRPDGLRATRTPPAQHLAPGAVPEIATPAVRARMGGGLLVAAAALVAVSVSVSPPSGADTGLLGIVAGLQAALGLLLIATGRRLRPWQAHLVPATAALLICLMILGSGGGTAALAFAALGVFVATYAFVAFGWWQATSHLLTSILAGAVCLSVIGSVPAGATLLGAGVTVVVGLTVGILTRVAGAAEHDRLTGLINQRGFDRALQAALHRAREDNAPLCVAFLDIDHFGRVSEVLGPAAADRLVSGAADAWRQGLDPDSTLARWSGDRFVALLPGHTPAAATHRIESLRGLLPGGHTCSAGVAPWVRGDSSSLLVNRAEALVYRAKRAGGNRVVATPNSGPVGELRQALDEGHLLTVYQPVMDLRTRRRVGAEALVRWAHPDRGLVSPGDFLPLARAGGLIVAIDRWVLATACRQAAAWHRRGRPAEINVNVSGQTLTAPGYLDHVRTVLAESGLPAGCLVLEITEDVLQAGRAEAVATLRALRDLRVRTAIDDFGTGYSSLSRLHELPVDILKIDRSFVADLVPPLPDTPVLKAIIGLGQGLGLDLVAEGIETVHQHRSLGDLGCRLGQGFLFGRPATAEELTRSDRSLRTAAESASGAG